MTRIGALFAGYGGLDLAVEDVTDGTTVWAAENNPGASAVLRARFPGIPNHGDVTKVDWMDVEPVDVLTGGFPCQDISSAGNRAGMHPGTRSGLWAHFAFAIAQLSPSLVVIENVRGLTSTSAARGLEPCPVCMGTTAARHLRALGVILGDLADLGYDAEWHGVRASDVGAPHRRFRIFVTAHPEGTHFRPRRTRPVLIPEPVRDLLTTPTAALADAGPQPAHKPKAMSPGRTTPTGATLIDQIDRMAGGTDVDDDDDPNLLPTPAVNDIGSNKTVEWWEEWTTDLEAKFNNSNGHGRSLAIEAKRLAALLPSPNARDYKDGGASTQMDEHGLLGRHAVNYFAPDALPTDATSWGRYGPAISRWADLVGRAPPPPTILTPKTGRQQLSPRFVEWMMGLPAGYVTDVPGVSRPQKLRMLGNGVVPQQAAAALALLLREEP